MAIKWLQLCVYFCIKKTQKSGSLRAAQTVQAKLPHALNMESTNLCSYQTLYTDWTLRNNVCQTSFCLVDSCKCYVAKAVDLRLEMQLNLNLTSSLSLGQCTHHHGFGLCCMMTQVVNAEGECCTQRHIIIRDDDELTCGQHCRVDAQLVQIMAIIA